MPSVAPGRPSREGAICGDRNWTDRAAIGRDVLTLRKGSTVIHGNARGADRGAGEIAHAHGLEDRRAELRAARHES